MPLFTVEGHHVAMVRPELAGISVPEVGPVIVNDKERQCEVRRAIAIPACGF